jgi:SAM-dependent methyltransferase
MAASLQRVRAVVGRSMGDSDQPEMPAAAGDGHDWREAGEAWGQSAIDWSCLYEHYAVEVIAAISSRTGIGPGDDVLDVACGSGLAIRHLIGGGARVCGLDASAALVEIARDRNPDADIRLGSMFALPWPDESFRVVISINGIWGGCEGAVQEMRRVARPGGMVAISFWGDGQPLDLRPCFKALAAHAPEPSVAGMRATNAIARPGVAEAMMTAAGLEMCERGSRVSTLEWPDADIAWRALSSIGPAVPALRASDPDMIRRDVLAAIDHCRDGRGVYRFRNDHQFVIARVPPGEHRRDV